MKNIYFLILLFLATSFLSFAQTSNDDLKFGETFNHSKNKRETFEHKYLGYSGDKTFYSNWDSEYFRLESIYQLDKNLNLEKEIPAKFKIDKKPIFFTKIINLNDKDLLLGFSHNQRKKITTLVRVDLAKGIEKNNIQTFHQFPFNQNDWFSGFKTKVIDAKGFKVSSNKEFIAFASPLKGRKKNSTQYIISVFDQNLHLLHEKELTFEHKGNDFVVVNFDINNNGEVFFLTKESKKNEFFEIGRLTSSKFLDKTKSTVQLYKLNEENVLKRLETPINSKYVFDIELHVNQEDELIIIGYCIKKEKGRIFFSKYDASGDLDINEYYPINLESPITLKRKNLHFHKALPSLLDIGNILINYDKKNYIVISEFLYKKKKTQNNQDNSFNIFSNDFFISCFSFDGELLWKKQIPKRFSTSEGKYYYDQLSYTFGYNSSGKMALIFYDYNFENASKLGKFFKEYHEKMRIEKIILDNDGEILSRGLLIEEERLDDFDLEINLSQSMKNHPNQLILFFTKQIIFKAAKAKIGIFNIPD